MRQREEDNRPNLDYVSDLSSAYYDSELDVQEENQDVESVNSEVSGVPWYLVDGKANAQEGIEVDQSKLEDIAQFKPSLPGPCSNDYVCFLVRYAMKNKILRKKKLTIDKLCGNPALFIGTESESHRLERAIHDALAK